jgi:hypothetical protein
MWSQYGCSDHPACQIITPHKEHCSPRVIRSLTRRIADPGFYCLRRCIRSLEHMSRACCFRKLVTWRRCWGSRERRARVPAATSPRPQARSRRRAERWSFRKLRARGARASASTARGRVAAARDFARQLTSADTLQTPRFLVAIGRHLSPARRPSVAVITKRREFRMAEVVVVRPFEELDRRDQLRLQPAASVHIFGR